MGHELQIGLFVKENDNKREYTRNRYGNMPEEDNQKLKEHKSRTIHSLSQENYIK